MTKKHQAIFIIGAPRSGTNMLRDVLTCLPGVGTWPCDEINYILRHGNVRYPSDEFTPDMATTSVSKYISRRFSELGASRSLDFVVEKTCANSLRVDFLDTIFPDAKYVFIVRDGLDVVASAIKRWKAELDIPYVLKKAKIVPLSDLPYYASRYVGSHIYRLFSSEKRVSSWGPRLDEMESILKEYTLEEVCAIQWQRYVEKAANSFAAMPSDKYIQIKYEDFVQNPKDNLESILNFINIPYEQERLEASVSGVFAGSIGKGQAELGVERSERIRAIIDRTLSAYGYQ